MRVAILTEADERIGYGHLARCTALYQAFESLGDEPELFIAGGGSPARLTSGLTHRPEDWREPYRIAAASAGADIVVIDSYVADGAAYASAAAEAAVLVCLDDTMRLAYPPGIVVNGAVRAAEMGYPRREDVTYLLGPAFAPLRAEFWDVPVKEISPAVTTALVALGGSDVARLAPRAVTALEQMTPGPAVIVVLGAGDETGLGERAQRLPVANATEVLAEMLKADLCVASAGQTLVEAACVGVPTVAVCVADNQRVNAQGWAGIGFAEYAGEVGERDLDARIASGVARLAAREERQRRCLKGRDTVDGRGALRVARRAVGQVLLGRITLDTPRPGDVRAVFALANDPDVRRGSFHPEPIAWQEHERWFDSRLKDPRSVDLLAYDGDALAGHVRFDVEDETATVSIALAAGYRGRGLGPLVLERGIEHLRRTEPRMEIVKAFVRPANAASVRTFCAAGFTMVARTEVEGEPALAYERPVVRVEGL